MYLLIFWLVNSECSFDCLKCLYQFQQNDWSRSLFELTDILLSNSFVPMETKNKCLILEPQYAFVIWKNNEANHFQVALSMYTIQPTVNISYFTYIKATHCTFHHEFDGYCLTQREHHKASGGKLPNKSRVWCIKSNADNVNHVLLRRMNERGFGKSCALKSLVLHGTSTNSVVFWKMPRFMHMYAESSLLFQKEMRKAHDERCFSVLQVFTTYSFIRIIHILKMYL